MKNTNNKNIVRLISLLLIVAVSCTDDWNELNINPNQPSKVPGTNVFGSGIVTVSNQLYGERIAIYYSGTWAGHTASIGLGDYEFRVGINNDQWNSLYRGMTYFVDAGKIAAEEGNDNLAAVALIMKAFTAHQVSDMWGDIPYSEAFLLADEGILNPVFDSQQDVYDQILGELEAAHNMLSPGGGDLGVGDFIFSGDIHKWKKFANSIRLRVAMRMSIVAPEAASQILNQILGNPAAYPVMEENMENAYLWWPGESSNIEPWRQRLGAPTNKTDQYRTNHQLISLLVNNNDPRLPVYADQNLNGSYNGYRMGPGQTSDPLNNANNVSHIGNRFGYDPEGFSPFMHAAQIWFIKAEAYERGLVSGGNAREAYEKGIEVSMEENGISPAEVEVFLTQPEVAWNSGSTTNLKR